MEKSELLIALIGVTATFVSILGGFLLTISHNINESKRKMEFEIELLYMEILKEQNTLSSQLITKIKKFEEESHRYSMYIDGQFGHIQLPYTSTLDYLEMRKNYKKDKKAVKIIKKQSEFLRYSKDFETFIRWSKLRRKWAESAEFQALYEFLSQNQTIEQYSLELNRKFANSFTSNEMKEYKKFINSTKFQRDQLFNQAIIIPSHKNQKFYSFGVVYLVSITVIGIICPFYFYSYSFSKDLIKVGMIIVCLLTSVYISLTFAIGLTSKRPKKMREKVRQYYL